MQPISDKSWQPIERGRASDSAGFHPSGGLLPCAEGTVPTVVQAEVVAELLAEVLRQCTSPPTEADFSWRYFPGNTNELIVSGQYTGDEKSVFDTIRLVVPPAGAAPRFFTNWLPPGRLPAVTLSQTNTPNDTITFGGGTFGVGEPLQLNLRFGGPAGTDDMKLDLFTSEGGTWEGPFPVLMK